MTSKPPTFLDHPRDIGARVRALRKERGVTAKRLAASAGVSAAYVSSIENGHRALTMHIAAKVADVLGVSLSDIGPTTAALPSANTPTENVASTAAVETGNGLAVFQYNAKNVRTLDMAGRRWAVAADICAILEIVNVTDAVQRLEPSDVLKISRSDTLVSTESFWNQVDPRVQVITLVSEDGATDLVLESRKPEARAFRRWLTHTVFPSIRDTGSYVHGDRDELDILKSTIEALIATRRTANEAKEIAERTAARLDAVEGKHDWYSALGYAKVHGLDLSMNQIQRLGQYAGSIGRENGIAPGKVQHQHFGTVNSYPEWVWDDAWGRMT